MWLCNKIRIKALNNIPECDNKIKGYMCVGWWKWIIGSCGGQENIAYLFGLVNCFIIKIIFGQEVQFN